jgi:diguanylate cyclase (GGDEF)-like protein
MDETNKERIDQLIQSAPGGLAKVAFDEMLTIIHATDTFYSLIKNVTDKAVISSPTSLLRMVYSADIIYVTHQLAAQKNRKDNIFQINFRSLQQNGNFKWVMITGNKTEEVYPAGVKSVPVYSCIAMDISDLMMKYKKLEQTNDYQRTIAELSKDLYFEYEIATDTLSFSELFREVFGKDSVMTGFRKRLEKTKMIHPEELPAVVGIYNSMMSGRKQVRFELRLLSKEGIANWYLCYASIIFDENRNPYKVVGKLSITTPAGKEVEPQQYKPYFDSLTNVYTKESSDYMITEAARKQSTDSLSALFLIDIKNYKNINDIRRSLGKENILTTIGGILKSKVRSSDIVGRMGLSEFVLYIKNIPSDKTAYELAENLCKSLEELHSYQYTKSGIAVTIGVAFHKGEQEYQTLLANANAALVMAKKHPASSFEIFSQIIN